MRVSAAGAVLAGAHGRVPVGDYRAALRRATAVTLLLDAAVPIEGVQDLLDHKHITTTQIYDQRRRSVRDSASHKDADLTGTKRQALACKNVIQWTEVPMPLLQLQSTAILKPNERSAVSSDKRLVHFTLLITGGTGEGAYLPLITLEGGTNESRKPMTLGATAKIDWPKRIEVGDPDGSAGSGGSPPGYTFQHGRDDVKFTYGEIQEVKMTATTKAIIDAGQLSIAQLQQFVGLPLTATVNFDSIKITNRGSSQPATITIQLTIYPETQAEAQPLTA